MCSTAASVGPETGSASRRSWSRLRASGRSGRSASILRSPNFAVEDEVNRAIVAALAMRLDPASGKGLVDPDPEHRGLRILPARPLSDELRLAASLRLAYHAFERAIGLDPYFAEAYAALAMTYAIDLTGTSGSWYDWVRPPGRARPQADVLAQKATSLSPGLHTGVGPRADALRNGDTTTRSRMPAARSSFSRATRSRTPHWPWRSPPRGQHQDARGQIDEALRRDPKAPAGDPRDGRHHPVRASRLSGRGRKSGQVSSRGMGDGGDWFYSPFARRRLLPRSGTGFDTLGSRQLGKRAWHRSASTSSIEVRKTCGICSRACASPACRSFRPGSTRGGTQAEPVMGEELARPADRPHLRGAVLVSSAEHGVRFSASGAVSWTARHDSADTGISRIDGGPDLRQSPDHHAGPGRLLLGIQDRGGQRLHREVTPCPGRAELMLFSRRIEVSRRRSDIWNSSCALGLLISVGPLLATGCPRPHSQAGRGRRHVDRQGTTAGAEVRPACQRSRR